MTHRHPWLEACGNFSRMASRKKALWQTHAPVSCARAASESKIENQTLPSAQCHVFVLARLTRRRSVMGMGQDALLRLLMLGMLEMQKCWFHNRLQSKQQTLALTARTPQVTLKHMAWIHEFMCWLAEMRLTSRSGRLKFPGPCLTNSTGSSPGADTRRGRRRGRRKKRLRLGLRSCESGGRGSLGS